MADNDDKVVLPRYWEKRVLAAYLLMMGETWDCTASKVGRSHTTIANWKNNEYWWGEARKEAERRWLYDVKDASRRAVYRQILDGDGDLGLKILERTDENLVPAKQKVDLESESLRELGAGLAALVRNRDGDSNR